MSELKKYDLYDGQICRDQDGEYYCVDEADAKIAAIQKRIDKLESAMRKDISKTGGNLRLEGALEE